MKILRYLFLLMGMNVAFALPQDPNHYAEFRPPMQSLYGSLVQLIAVLLQDDKVTGKERSQMEEHFKNLAIQSATIKALAMKSDKGHQTLAEELARDTQAAYTHFKSGHDSQARFFLSDVVNTCFSCHTSRNGSEDSQFSVNFNKDVKWDSFQPLAKARFLALSRQFDAASDAYEKLFFKGGLSTDNLVNEDPFLEYMIIGLRVKAESPRILKTLEQMDKKDYPEILKKDIQGWVRVLKDLPRFKSSGSALRDAKEHIRLAKMEMEYPSDRAAIIRYILASTLLQDFIKAKGISSADKAEAYYELGLCELTIGSNLFSDESLAYFEETVRLLPGSSLAKKAFAQFEDILRNGYTGSAGTQLPEEEKRRIETLKKMAF